MKVKKALITILACVMMMGFSPIGNVGFAAVNPGSQISPQYTYTRKVSAWLMINSSGRATCIGSVGVYDKDSTVSMTLKLLRKDGNVWRTVKTWTDSGSGEIDFSMKKEYTVISGVYKLSVSAKITTTSGGSESVSKSTGENEY